MMFGKGFLLLFLNVFFFIVSLGYFKYQEIEIQMIQYQIIFILGYIKNSMKTILMLQNIDFSVNLMICHMVI